MSEQLSAPRDIRIPEAKQPLFKELTTSSDSPFCGQDMKDLFVLAAAFGYSRGLRTDLEDVGHALFNREALSESQVWILKSIAVKETEDPETLKNGKLIYEIAREYANGGVDELYSQYTGPVDMFANLSIDVIETADL